MELVATDDSPASPGAPAPPSGGPPVVEAHRAPEWLFHPLFGIAYLIVVAALAFVIKGGQFQLLIPLLLAVLATVLVIRDLEARGRQDARDRWGWGIATILFGPLSYLAYTLARARANTDEGAPLP